MASKEDRKNRREKYREIAARAAGAASPFVGVGAGMAGSLVLRNPYVMAPPAASLNVGKTFMAAMPLLSAYGYIFYKCRSLAQCKAMLNYEEALGRYDDEAISGINPVTGKENKNDNAVKKGSMPQADLKELREDAPAFIVIKPPDRPGYEKPSYDLDTKVKRRPKLPIRIPKLPGGRRG